MKTDELCKICDISNALKTKYEARLLKEYSRIQEKIIRALDTAPFCKTYLGARKYVNRAKRLRKKAEAIKYRLCAMNREIVALYSNMPVYSGTVKSGKHYMMSKETPPKTGKTALQADAELKKEFDNDDNGS